MSLKQKLINGTVEIIDSQNLLFEDIKYNFNQEEESVYYKLYLLKNRDDDYSVSALTTYISDDDFITSLSAFDEISYPLSLEFKKTFHHLHEAKSFYDDVVKKCPKPIQLMEIIPETTKIYGYDSKNSIRYKFGKGKVWEDDFFENELVRHGYQRIMIRMFRFKNEVIINKTLKLEFETEEESQRIFQLIKQHFSKAKLTTYKCKNEEMEFNQLLEKLVKKSIKSSNQKIEVRRDFLDRITELSLKFTHKKADYSIQYSLPTRNGHYHGYTMSGSIYKCPGKGFLGSDYDTYKNVSTFKQDIKKIFGWK